LLRWRHLSIADASGDREVGAARSRGQRTASASGPLVQQRRQSCDALGDLRLAVVRKREPQAVAQPVAGRREQRTRLEPGLVRLDVPLELAAVAPVLQAQPEEVAALRPP